MFPSCSYINENEMKKEFRNEHKLKNIKFQINN